MSVSETGSWRLCVLASLCIICLTSFTALVVAFVAMHDVKELRHDLPTSTLVPTAKSLDVATRSDVKASLRASLLKNAQLAERKIVATTEKIVNDIDVVDTLSSLGDKTKNDDHSMHFVVQEEKRSNAIHLARGRIQQQQRSAAKQQSVTTTQQRTVAPKQVQPIAGVGATLRKVQTLQDRLNNSNRKKQIGRAHV